MSWTFTNSGLLPWLLMALAPLVLHLVARVRPPVYPFSSTEFIRRIVRHRLRVRRPQEWLLLLLRTFVMMFLILLFLQPRLFTEQRLTGLNRQRHVVVIVDATASMNYQDGAQTRFAQAVAEASEVLNGLRSGDTANLIWLRYRPAAAFPEPGANIPALLDDLRRQTCTLEAGDIIGTFAMAREQVRGLDGDREIVVISDFQASTWQGIALDAGTDARVLLLRVGLGDGENAAVAGVRVVPAQPLVGETVEFHCEVRNYAMSAQQRNVQFALGDARQSLDLQIPARGGAMAVFRQKIAEPGRFFLHVSLTPDRFPADDEFHDQFEVRDKTNVGLLRANPHTADVWNRCLQALGWVNVVPLNTVAHAARQSLEALVVAGWDGSAAGELLDLAAAGLTVILEPARTAVLRAPDGFAGMPFEGTWEQPREPLSVSLSQPEHAVFRLFTEGDYGSPASGMQRGRCRLQTTPTWNSLIAYTDGQPALGQLAAGELCWWWNLALDTEFGSYAAQPQFIALTGEILQYGRARAGPPVRPVFACGESLLLRTDAQVNSASVRLTHHSGTPLGLLPTSVAVGAFISQPAPQPGLYTWTVDGQRLGASLVHFPAAESDLRQLDPGRANPDAVAIRGGSAIHRLRAGHDLWPLFLVLCLLFLLLEGIALRWLDRFSTH